MSDVFDESIEEVLKSLDPPMLERLENLAIIVEPEPPEGVLALGCFRGVPLQQHRIYMLIEKRPNEIVLFEGPIRRQATGLDDLKSVIRGVIRHELGHYFGLTHDDMGATLERA